ncbi:type IV pilus biogenesis protein PilM [Paenibacillus koleovorans]|uniref:type IV pilus biogenesis protein PilM n=1 Tax=Paenibacillus koleovorans TaxID=121608 RepID=UPI000FDA178B|nr:pilus assembly protein PilM [Paenibacillus koleovorans]
MTRIGRLLHSWKPVYSSLGLELTDRQIKLVEAGLGSKMKPIVYQHAIEKLPDGAVVDGRIKQGMPIIVQLKRMLRSKPFRAKRVHLVLPSQLIMVRFLKLPDIPVKDLRKVVAFELNHNLHLPFDHPYYDFAKLNGSNNKKAHKPMKKASPAAKPQEPAFQETAAAKDQPSVNNMFADFESPASAPASDVQPPALCDVMLVAAPRELIDEYVAIVKAAGLVPATIEFKAMSLLRLALSIEMVKSDETFMVVDINETGTDLSIFHRTELKITRNVPLPVPSTITAADQKTPASDSGADWFAEFNTIAKVDDPLQAFSGDLLHEIERLMNFYRYTLNNRDHEFTSIILSGDVEGLADIEEYCKARFPELVRLLFSYRIHIDATDPFTLLPKIAVPLGVGLRGKET